MNKNDEVTSGMAEINVPVPIPSTNSLLHSEFSDINLESIG